MNKIIAVVLLSVLLYSCIGRKDSGCEYTGTVQSTCMGKKLAEICLSDSSLAFIDTNSSGFTMKNKAGYSFYFEYVKRKKYAGVQNLIERSYQEYKYCDWIQYHCFDYAKTENEEVNFYNSKLGFEFVYRRASRIKTFKGDSSGLTEIDSADLISIIINTLGNSATREFFLPINGFNEGKSAFYDTLSINGLQYAEVYTSYIDTPIGTHDFIIPAGIYYTAERKLVGFYLSNGEVWNLP